MLRYWMFVFMPLGLWGCTTVVLPELAITQINQCAAPKGASLKYNTLTLALGERPSAGYGIELLSVQQRGEVVEIRYRERQPTPPSARTGKTSPCMQLTLPHGWQKLVLIDQASARTLTLSHNDDRAQESK